MNISLDHTEKSDKHIRVIKMVMTKRVIPSFDLLSNIIQIQSKSFISYMIVISKTI